MIEFYPEIRLVHIWSVIASGSLFALRGAAHFSGAKWALHPPLRYTSYTIDTVLLTTALMLITMLRQYPFAQPWLTVKVLLLVVYIGLGYYAFWRARSRAAGIAAWAAALTVFALIVSVARAHHPLGVLRTLIG